MICSRPFILALTFFAMLLFINGLLVIYDIYSLQNYKRCTIELNVSNIICVIWGLLQIDFPQGQTSFCKYSICSVNTTPVYSRLEQQRTLIRPYLSLILKTAINKVNITGSELLILLRFTCYPFQSKLSDEFFQDLLPVNIKSKSLS